MAVRYPLVIDATDNNKIKELPLNDSLNLSTNSIVNAVNITASGTLTVANLVVDSNSVSINGNSIATVALTNSYTDLSNKPSLFDGQYSSLTGRPTIVATTEDLADVSSTQATNGQALIYNSTSGVYEPGSIADASIDLTDQDIGEMQNVVLSSPTANQILKYNGTAFVNTSVEFSEITSRPTTLAGYGITDAQVAGALTDGDIKGSVFADDSTLLVDGVNGVFIGDVTGDVTGTLIIPGGAGIRLPVSRSVYNQNTPDVYDAPTDNLSVTSIRANTLQSLSIVGNTTGYHTGDITGSVFGDDSTLLVDGVNNTVNALIQGGMQEIVGPGVVNITTTSTEIVTTGTDAYTLANGTYGQVKHIIKIGGTGAATITPASFANGTSVELAANFNSVSLLYTNSGWAVIAEQNITINA